MAMSVILLFRKGWARSSSPECAMVIDIEIVDDGVSVIAIAGQRIFPEDGGRECAELRRDHLLIILNAEWELDFRRVQRIGYE